MIPHQVTLQQNTAIEVFSHVKFIRLETEEDDLATMYGINTNGGEVQFTVFGRDTIRRFRKKIKPGNYVNLVAESGIIRRIYKGIDMEV